MARGESPLLETAPAEQAPQNRGPAGNALALAPVLAAVTVTAHTPLILLTLAAPFIWLDTAFTAFKHGESLGA